MESIASYHFQTVHFPIALTLTSLLLMLIGFWKKHENLLMASRYVLYLATLSALIAMTTGLLAEEYLPHAHEGEVHSVMEWHQYLGFVIVGLLVITSYVSYWVEKKQYQSMRKNILLLLIVVASLVIFTGYLGGRLGHEFGIGIHEVPSTQQETKSEDDGHEETENEDDGHDHSH